MHGQDHLLVFVVSTGKEHSIRSVGWLHTFWLTHVTVTVFKLSSAAHPITAEVEVKFRRTPLIGIDGRMVQLTEIVCIS